MSLSDSRWHVITESEFPHEREALEFLRANLPDRNPWHVWTNFEFIDDHGNISEVDALVLSPAGLILVEIKSWSGVITGDAHSWTGSRDGRSITDDNPLLLANRKAKRLASLLRHQPAIRKAKIRLPFVEAAIFLSSTSLAVKLEGLARTGTFLRGKAGEPDGTGDGRIVNALAEGISNRGPGNIDSHVVKAILNALPEAGIRRSNKHRKVGDYRLGSLLAEGEGYQDWHAQHVTSELAHRRIRIYPFATAATDEARAVRLRQAKREFEILEGINHPGILKVNDYTETERGPALIFDHDPKAVRLDHLLRDHGETLSLTQQLQLVRDIAETLHYAHGKHLYHRALGPQSILIHGVGTGSLQPQLMNWRTGSRNAGDSASPETAHHTTGTQHVDEYIDEPGMVYVAPEARLGDTMHGARLDVFSLGCLAYHIFSGQAPAESVLAMMEKLRAGHGLRLSAVMDGCVESLQDLVLYATNPEVFGRWDTVQAFLQELDKVEDELTAPDPEVTVDPSVAKPNDRLEGGFTVVRRVGRGSSSEVLLVRHDDSAEELILKVASDLAQNDRLIAEGKVLADLRHQSIVAHKATLSIAGRTALVLKNAGTNTLARELKDNGRLSLEKLRRFGEELIQAVCYLEAEGVAHRDIKPENIGILERKGSNKEQLVLFDFSLCRTPATNITAGTHPYLEPFLTLRRPQRWDLYAERYALAVTLYEMTVGQPPVWGDGLTDPSLLPDVEVTIEHEVFAPVTRAGFASFFTRALKREYRDRFDNAEDMLRTWRAIFTENSAAPPKAGDTPAGIEKIAVTVSAETTMAELGYSPEAQEILDRMNIRNARELLAVDRIKFRYLNGVGERLRKEIRLTAKELARLRPDLTLSRTTILDADEQSAGPASIDELARQLLPRRPAGDDRADEAALAWYLGLDEATEAGEWPSLGQTTQATGVARSVLATALIRARARWLKTPSFTELRQQLETVLHGQGQVMTMTECAATLLALRGSAVQNDADRRRQATAVLRALIEAEANLEQPRYQSFGDEPVALIATSAGWAEFALQLGEAADRCATADPLLAPTRTLEDLRRVALPAAEGGTTAERVPDTMAPSRLLRLATAASKGAALSSRQEIYPRGMAPLQALRQSLGALIGATSLTVQSIHEGVLGRYPQASPLPGRPELDALLRAAQAPFSWSATAFDGLGGYVRPASAGAERLSTATDFSRLTTHAGTTATQEGELAEAAHVEQRLERSITQGGLLVLTVNPRFARRAEAELLHRFGPAGDQAANQLTRLQRVSFDALLLAALREQADTVNVQWSVVIEADAAERTSRHWINLQRLVQRALPTVKAALLNNDSPILLVNTGLLARYDLMNIITEAEASTGRPDHTPALWLLLPTTQQGLPVIDGVTVPIVNNLNNTRTFALPKAWIENRHRAAEELP